ncbi:MAG: ComEC/Rec2 family competence protein [Verrucomicrobiota bacterium]
MAFPLFVVALGNFYGTSFAAPPNLPQPSFKPIREALFEIEPTQTFTSPPYAPDQVGLANVSGRDTLLYYSVPSLQGTILLEGFSYEVVGVERPLSEEMEAESFTEFLLSRGVSGRLRSFEPAQTIAVTRPAKALFAILLERAKSSLSLGSSLTEPATRVYKAIVLGQRTALDTQQKQVFRDTGTAHLFAISGLHIGLIGMLLFWLFGKAPIGQPVRVSCTLSILLFYVLLTGSTPSAVRAFLMIAFLVSAKAFARGYRPSSALMASAFVVLLFDPRQLFTLGFQLSYLVVFSILVFGIPLASRLMEQTDPEYWLPGDSGSPFHRSRKWLLGSFAISLSAFLGSSPLVMSNFGVLPLASIPLNIILIPLATAVLFTGFIALLFGLLGLDWIATLLNEVALPITELMTAIVAFTAKSPLAALPISWNNDWAGTAGVLMIVLSALWVSFQKEFRYRYLLFPFLSLLLSLGIGYL